MPGMKVLNRTASCIVVVCLFGFLCVSYAEVDSWIEQNDAPAPPSSTDRPAGWSEQNGHTKLVAALQVLRCAAPSLATIDCNNSFIFKCREVCDACLRRTRRMTKKKTLGPKRDSRCCCASVVVTKHYAPRNDTLTTMMHNATMR